jgi:hypothetical protein
VLAAGAFSSDNSRQMDLKHAYEHGVAELYKFRCYGSAQECERVRQILKEHRVYFSRASQLNDEDDLRPRIRFRRAATDAESRAILLADAERVWSRRPVPHSAEELARFRTRLATIPLEQLECEGMLRAHRRLEENYPIFSLARTRDYVDMWKRYAGDGTGLCIHFRADDQSPFGLAQRVSYGATLPELLVPFDPSVPEEEFAHLAVMTKLLKWQVEDEYRLIRYPDVDFTPIGLRFDGQFGYFPGRCLAGITVGLAMPTPQVEEILEMAEAHDPPLPVWRPTGELAG